MDFDQFVAYLTAGLDLDLGPVALDESTPLRELELDSLGHAELWLLLESLGMDLPEELFGSLRTVGDVYHYYRQKVLDGTEGSSNPDD